MLLGHYTAMSHIYILFVIDYTIDYIILFLGALLPLLTFAPQYPIHRHQQQFLGSQLSAVAVMQAGCRRSPLSLYIILWHENMHCKVGHAG